MLCPVEGFFCDCACVSHARMINYKRRYVKKRSLFCLGSGEVACVCGLGLVLFPSELGKIFELGALGVGEDF